MTGKEFLISLHPHQAFNVIDLETLTNNRAIWLPALGHLCVSLAAARLLADADTSQEALFNLNVTVLTESGNEGPFRVYLEDE